MYCQSFRTNINKEIAENKTYHGFGSNFDGKATRVRNYSVVLRESDSK